MSLIFAETHFEGRPRAVAELFFHLCISEGFRNADVMEAGIDTVESSRGGPIVVDGFPLDEVDRGHVLLITPQDRSGWCVAYPSSHDLGQSMLELLGQPCPLEKDEQTWEEHLDIAAAVHGFVSEQTAEWGWTLRVEHKASELSHLGARQSEPTKGKDVASAFAAVGRLFGQVDLVTVLHRLMELGQSSDKDTHKLLWTASRQSSA